MDCKAAEMQDHSTFNKNLDVVISWHKQHGCLPKQTSGGLRADEDEYRTATTTNRLLRLFCKMGGQLPEECLAKLELAGIPELKERLNNALSRALVKNPDLLSASKKRTREDEPDVWIDHLDALVSWHAQHGRLPVAQEAGEEGRLARYINSLHPKFQQGKLSGECLAKLEQLPDLKERLTKTKARAELKSKGSRGGADSSGGHEKDMAAEPCSIDADAELVAQFKSSESEEEVLFEAAERRSEIQKLVSRMASDSGELHALLAKELCNAHAPVLAKAEILRTSATSFKDELANMFTAT